MSAALNLRIALLLQVVAGAAVAAWLLPPGLSWAWALLAAPVVPVVGPMIVLAVEFLIAAIFDPRSPRIGIARAIRIWWDEVWVSFRAFAWRQPFHAGFDAPPMTRDPARPAVLLVHGYVCNHAVWQPLLHSGLLARYNVATVNLAPIFADIREYGEQVALAVERLREHSGAARVVLVGHSMGGLAIRAYLAQHGAATVRAVVTLGSPHGGTLLGRLGQGRNAKQMVPGSDFLRELASRESVEIRRLFTCMTTLDDNLIVPRTSPLLPDARHVRFEGVGHLALIEHPPAWQVIVDVIERSRVVTPHASETPTIGSAQT